GTVSAANSLVGSTAGDNIGSSFLITLGNGNYVVRSPNWNGNRGAVTWGDGTGGTVGVVSAANSLVGGNAGDNIGLGGVIRLTNENYVTRSTAWNGQRGAVTWGDGTGGTVGVVSAANSLVGGNAFDWIGSRVMRLSNGNYVTYS